MLDYRLHPIPMRVRKVTDTLLLMNPLHNSIKIILFDRCSNINVGFMLLSTQFPILIKVGYMWKLSFLLGVVSLDDFMGDLLLKSWAGPCYFHTGLDLT